MSESKPTGRGKHGKQKLISDPSLRGRKDNPKVNMALKNEMITKIIGWICDGMQKPEIVKLIMVNLPVKISDVNAYKMITEATERMESISMQDAELVIANHIELYERIWAYFDKIGNASGANKALRAKESLLNLIEKKKITINQKKSTVIHREVVYDIRKLTPAEQKRFNELINKAKS